MKRRALALYRRCHREAIRWDKQGAGAELARKARELFRQHQDVHDPSRVKQLVEQGEQRLDVLLHNARLTGSLIEHEFVQKPEVYGYTLPSEEEQALSWHTFPPNPTLSNARKRARRRRRMVAPDNSND